MREHPGTGTADGDRAVTPVIATVTMVAITVALAAVLGAAMLGLSGGLRAGAPQLSMDLAYVSDGNDYEVVATVTGGQPVTRGNTGNVTLVADSGHERAAPPSKYPLDPGDDIALSADTGSGPVPPGTNVRVIWTGPDGDATHVVVRGRTPY